MQTPTRSIRLALVALALVCTGGLVSAGALGGQQPTAPPPPPPDQIVSIGEIQRMFEAVALVRSQDVLKISDEKYLPFLTKYKTLQDARRRTQQERSRILSDLNKLANDPAGDEGQIKERLKALNDLQIRGDIDIRKAQEGVD